MASPQCSPRMNVPSDHGREMMTHQSTPWHPEPSATPGAPTTISGLRTDLTSGLGLPSIESAMRATGCDPTTFRLSSKEHPGLTSHSSMDTDNDEEAIMYTSTRMLEEPSGRLGVYECSLEMKTSLFYTFSFPVVEYIFSWQQLT